MFRMYSAIWRISWQRQIVLIILSVIIAGLAAVPLVFPVPIMLLGTVVVIVQALVFSLLALVYIALAIEHSEEAH